MAKSIQRPAPRKPAITEAVVDPFFTEDDLSINDDEDDGDAESAEESPHDLAIASGSRYLQTLTTGWCLTLDDYKRFASIFNSWQASKKAESPILVEGYVNKAGKQVVAHLSGFRSDNTFNKEGAYSVSVLEASGSTRWLQGSTLLILQLKSKIRMFYDPSHGHQARDKGEGFDGYLVLRDEFSSAESAPVAAKPVAAKPPVTVDLPSIDDGEDEETVADGEGIDPAVFLQCSMLEALIEVADSTLEAAVLKSILDSIGEDEKTLYKSVAVAMNSNKPK